MVVMASARDLITYLRGTRACCRSRPTCWRPGASATSEEQRGGPEVLPDGRVRFGDSCSTACRCSMAVVPARRCSSTSASRTRLLRFFGSRSSEVVVGIAFVLVGFAFKVSAVPFHQLGARHLRGSAHPGDRRSSPLPPRLLASWPLLNVSVRRLLRSSGDVWEPVLMWALAAAVDDRRQPHRPCGRRTSCACWPTPVSPRPATCSPRSRSPGAALGTGREALRGDR